MEQRWHMSQGKIDSIAEWNRLVDHLQCAQPIRLAALPLTEAEKVLLQETAAQLRIRSTVAME
jgi:hypothetical protein